MDAQGYGGDIELTDEAVLITHSERAQKFGKMPAVVTTPLADIRSVEFKAANPMVNGSLVIVTDDAATKQTRVVHWRRKDNDAFVAIHSAILGAVEAASA